MACIQASLTSSTCKDNSASDYTSRANICPQKSRRIAISRGIDHSHKISFLGKNEVSTLRSVGARAALAVDPSASESVKEKRSRHTVDPLAPEFLPLPPFEQRFPNSMKEFKEAVHEPTGTVIHL